MTGGSEKEGTERSRGITELVGSYALSYLTAILLLGSLVHAAGIWNVLANTRLLDLAINSGLVRYHDLDLGIVDGLPDHGLYLLTLDPVDWRLVGLVVLLYFGFWGLRALKFHGIARLLGMKGSLADHSGAFFYGAGLDILAPFRLGSSGVVEACREEGESSRLAGAAVYSYQAFILFGIAVFAAASLLVAGWSTWLGGLFWSGMIFAAAFLVLEPTRREEGTVLAGRASREDQEILWSVFSDAPLSLAKIAGITLLAFFVHHASPYVLAQAFTTEHVVLNTPFWAVQLGIVAGYVASQVALTPGGIGQFEWGFAAGLYMTGLGLPEAATIALLESVVRNGTGLTLFGLVTVWKGVSTEVARVFAAVLREPEAVR